MAVTAPAGGRVTATGALPGQAPPRASAPVARLGHRTGIAPSVVLPTPSTPRTQTVSPSGTGIRGTTAETLGGTLAGNLGGSRWGPASSTPVMTIEPTAGTHTLGFPAAPSDSPASAPTYTAADSDGGEMTDSEMPSSQASMAPRGIPWLWILVGVFVYFAFKRHGR